MLLALIMAALAAMPRMAHAQEANSAPPPPASAADDGLDLDAMPDIGIDWPDLGAPEQPLPPEPTPDISAEQDDPFPPEAAASGDGAQPPLPSDSALIDRPEDAADSAALAAIDPGAPLHYHVTLKDLTDAADATLLTRFDTLSVLKQGEGDPANLAQIRRRGQSDTELLDELLRARGFYDSRSRLSLRVEGNGASRINAILDGNPGPRYLLGSVNVQGLDGTSPLGQDLGALFPVKAGDPADTDAILAATEKLRTGLGEGGYPFADVREPVLTVDHQQRGAFLNLNVTTGGFRRFGDIMVNADAPFDAEHVAVIGRFSPGEPFNQTDITDLNRALIATGLVSQVTITPEEGKDPETVDLAVNLTKAPVRTIAGEIGYGTGEGARIEASWQHRNLFPPEGAVTVRGVLGTQEQTMNLQFRRSNFGSRDRALNAEIGGGYVDRPAYSALIAGIAASLERQTNIIFQKTWTWSLGAELRISDERDLYGPTQEPRRRTYVIAALPTSINYDGSDDLLDPRTGFRLGGRLSPELSLQDGVFAYVRAQVDGSAYLPMGERFTLAGRVRLGTIVGASADRIAPTRRFYAGGGASVRGYGYQAIGPRDADNNPTGGRSLGEVSIEARYRFGSANQFGVVPFIDAGSVSPDLWPSIDEMRVGVGMGFRYYSSFGPIRVDIGTPLNPQPGDSPVGVYVSLGQAF